MRTLRGDGQMGSPQLCVNGDLEVGVAFAVGSHPVDAGSARIDAAQRHQWHVALPESIRRIACTKPWFIFFTYRISKSSHR